MKGFTLIETVVALVVLQVAVLGVLGSAFLAIRTVEAAEATALRARAAASILDSLRVHGRPGTGFATPGRVEVEWTIDSIGVLDLRARTPDGADFELHSVLLFR